MVISLRLNQIKSDTLRKEPKESVRKYNFGLEMGKGSVSFGAWNTNSSVQKSPITKA